MKTLESIHSDVNNFKPIEWGSVSFDDLMIELCKGSYDNNISGFIETLRNCYAISVKNGKHVYYISNGKNKIIFKKDPMLKFSIRTDLYILSPQYTGTGRKFELTYEPACDVIRQVGCTQLFYRPFNKLDL